MFTSHAFKICPDSDHLTITCSINDSVINAVLPQEGIYYPGLSGGPGSQSRGRAEREASAEVPEGAQALRPPHSCVIGSSCREHRVTRGPQDKRVEEHLQQKTPRIHDIGL